MGHTPETSIQNEFLGSPQGWGCIEIAFSALMGTFSGVHSPLIVQVGDGLRSFPHIHCASKA